MSDFEFIFTLYSLLLGLSMAEILAGLGRAIERRAISPTDASRRLKLGWLTPLLATFVILDLLSFWSFAWFVREELAVNRYTLLGVTAFACAYYVAARLVFPGESNEPDDLDDHFFRVRRVVLGILLARVAVQWAYNLSIPDFLPRVLTARSLITTGVLVALMALAIAARSRKTLAIVMVALIVRYVVLFIW